LIYILKALSSREPSTSSSISPAASFFSSSVASSPGLALKIEAVNKRLIFGLPVVICYGSVNDAAPILLA
jgi:hypothetical protein